MVKKLFCAFIPAITDSGEDPEVIRAKYFIRDEFLVSVTCYYFPYILILDFGNTVN